MVPPEECQSRPDQVGPGFTDEVGDTLDVQGYA